MPRRIDSVELARRGALIKEAREHRDWTIAELARKAGVDRTRASRVEAGKAGESLATVVALFMALDIDLNLLKSETDESDSAAELRGA